MYIRTLCQSFRWRISNRSSCFMTAGGLKQKELPVISYWQLQKMPFSLSPSSHLPGTKPAQVVEEKPGPTEPPKTTKLRSLADMPGPKSYPFIGTMSGNVLGLLNTTAIIPFFLKRTKEFFPHGLYKERLIGNDIVILISAEAIEKFFRNEAKYPNRFSIPSWMDYREVSGEEYGVFTGRDEQWHRMRSVVDKPMLRLKDVKSYTEEINEVVTDFLTRIEKIRGEDKIIPNFDQELFNWSLESIGTVLYERRFGGLSDHRDPEMERFINAVGQMFFLTMELFSTPPWLAKVLRRKKYKQHYEAWDLLFNTAKKCVNKRMDEIDRQLQKGEEVQGVLAYLLAQKSMTVKEIYANITELMMASVDTTSTTVLWCLYEISQKPEIQEKLFAEVTGSIGQSIPSYEDLQNMPYLKAVVKETLRMYPVAGSISRVTEEKMEVCGYEIPPKTAVSITLYCLTRLPEYFENPNDFVPDRWMKDRADRPNPFTSLPFGIGTRMCVGRRVAELEMYLLLSRLIQKYRVEPAFTEPAVISMRLTLQPDRPIRLKLINRETG